MRHFTKAIPTIPASIQAAAFANEDILFDWSRFEIPMGEACIKNFNIIMPGTNGSAGNAVDFVFFAILFNLT